MQCSVQSLSLCLETSVSDMVQKPRLLGKQEIHSVERHNWPIAEILWITASLCKISLKLDNQMLSYGQKKNHLQYDGHLPCSILKIFIFDHVIVIKFQVCCCVPNFIKITWFFVEVWRFNDFQDGGSPLSWILWVQEWVIWKTHVGLPIGRQ